MIFTIHKQLDFKFLHRLTACAAELFEGDAPRMIAVSVDKTANDNDHVSEARKRAA